MLPLHHGRRLSRQRAPTDSIPVRLYPRNRRLSRVAPTTPLGYNAGMNLVISLLSLGGWVVWGYTTLFVDPNVPLAPLAFYAALFVALTCTLARLMGGSRSGESGHGSNLGHASIVSMVLLFALWLQSLHMLTPLNGILLASMLAFIELGFFLSRGSRRGTEVRRRPRLTVVPTARTADEG